VFAEVDFDHTYELVYSLVDCRCGSYSNAVLFNTPKKTSEEQNLDSDDLVTIEQANCCQNYAVLPLFGSLEAISIKKKYIC
jgi:hypothetical protein